MLVAGSAAAKGVMAGANALEDAPVGSLASRVESIHDALDPIAKNHRTTAGLDTIEGTRLIGSGTRDLSPAQRAALAAGEVAAKMPKAHAEVTVLETAKTL